MFFIDILPPWKMYFDGATRCDGVGAGVVFASPEEYILPCSFVLTELCSNNVIECQALSLGLRLPIETGIRDLNIYNDSQLVINELLDEYEVKKQDLVPYHKQAL